MRVFVRSFKKKKKTCIANYTIYTNNNEAAFIKRTRQKMSSAHTERRILYPCTQSFIHFGYLFNQRFDSYTVLKRFARKSFR